MADLRRRLQMIFQDPYQTLNPRQRVRTIVAEPLRGPGRRQVRAPRAGQAGARGRRPRPGALQRALPASALGRPAPASGDRRGARARARRADLRRAGLDARRLGAGADPRVLLDLQEQRELALLFITHDLSLAWSLCDRIAVMYLGRIVEEGDGRRRDRAPAAPLHAGAGRPRSRSRRPAAAARAGAAQRRAPRPDRRPVGLPVPSALPEALRARATGSTRISTTCRARTTGPHACCTIPPPRARRPRARPRMAERWRDIAGPVGPPRARRAQRDHRRARGPRRPLAGRERRAHRGDGRRAAGRCPRRPATATRQRRSAS